MYGRELGEQLVVTVLRKWLTTWLLNFNRLQFLIVVSGLLKLVNELVCTKLQIKAVIFYGLSPLKETIWSSQSCSISHSIVSAKISLDDHK